MALSACKILVKWGKNVFSGGLVHEFFKGDDGQIKLMLGVGLVKFLQQGNITFLDEKIRHGLRGKALAGWLWRFYSTHAQPYPLSVRFLRELSGSEAVSLIDFKKNLKKSLVDVGQVLEQNGQTFGFRIEGDMVHVFRTCSSSQKRHVLRRSLSILHNKT